MGWRTKHNKQKSTRTARDKRLTLTQHTDTIRRHATCMGIVARFHLSPVSGAVLCSHTTVVAASAPLVPLNWIQPFTISRSANLRNVVSPSAMLPLLTSRPKLDRVTQGLRDHRNRGSWSRIALHHRQNHSSLRLTIPPHSPARIMERQDHGVCQWSMGDWRGGDLVGGTS